MGLKSEIEALEAEIAEVQDTFRYKIRKKTTNKRRHSKRVFSFFTFREKDAKEFKRVKWELGKNLFCSLSFVAENSLKSEIHAL